VDSRTSGPRGTVIRRVDGEALDVGCGVFAIAATLLILDVRPEGSALRDALLHACAGIRRLWRELYAALAVFFAFESSLFGRG